MTKTKALILQPQRRITIINPPFHAESQREQTAATYLGAQIVLLDDAAMRDEPPDDGHELRREGFFHCLVCGSAPTCEGGREMEAGAGR